MKIRLSLRLISACFLCSVTVAKADRVVHVANCHLGNFQIVISNPSAVAQSVKVDFVATGSPPPTISNDLAGYGTVAWLAAAMNCPDTRHCSSKPPFDSLAPGANRVFGTSFSIIQGNNPDPSYGVSAKITVTGDKGYLVGNELCWVNNTGSGTGFPLNAGRPF